MERDHSKASLFRSSGNIVQQKHAARKLEFRGKAAENTGLVKE
jgi:hypothetical protein